MHLQNICTCTCKIAFYMLLALHLLGSLNKQLSRRESVPKKKVSKIVLSKNIKNKRSPFDKKLSIDELPFHTVQVTMRALRWIFLIIFFYISVSIILLFIQGGNELVQNIVIYSVTGFFTFFMGYFGWMFARSVMEIVGGKPRRDDF